MKERTLTNLYNKPPEWLRLCHERLDRAVCAAYGWRYEELFENGEPQEDEILQRLLALNLQRGGGEVESPETTPW